MRKLLSSKKCSNSCACQDDENPKVRSRKPNRQSKKYPKQHIHPIWTQRNDSSNVSAVLHPDDYLQSPRSPYTITSKQYRAQEDEAKGAFKKCCLAGNTCYCRDVHRIKPTLISRPNKCLEDEGGKLLPGGGFRRCLCKDMELIRQHQEEIEDRCSCLKYSRQREDYESFREQQEEEEKEEEEKEEGSIATLLGTKTGDSQTASTEGSSLSKFRRDHYFDTHSTDDLSKDTPEHTHVHQYKLDDRLLPEPINVDPYGRSRCSVCSSTKDGSFPCSDSCRDVCVCDGESQVELKLDRKDLERFGGFVGRFRRPEYFNTLALRQQKMLRHRRRLGSNVSDVYY